MLKGPDVSIKISLKEYGLAWEIGETETRFYYGVNNEEEYIGFDWADLENDLNVYKEYAWAEFEDVLQFTGMSQKEWEKLPLTWKIQDLISYYGSENIFGSSYAEPMTYEEVIRGK